MTDDTITPIDQPDGITYGDSSREMWELINGTSKHSYSVWKALYAMACKMQELESLIRNQKQGLRSMTKQASLSVNEPKQRPKWMRSIFNRLKCQSG